jgi:hypothetical protein
VCANQPCHLRQEADGDFDNILTRVQRLNWNFLGTSTFLQHESVPQADAIL